MSTTLSLPQAAPATKSRIFLKFCLGLLVILIILLAWLMVMRIDNRSAALALNLVAVKIPMSTAITDVMVTQNQKVESGQPLVKIDISGYSGQLPEAMALARGTFSQEVSSRVTQAENMEADMVKRTAIARHEENTMRTAVEHYSTEHARTLVHLRSIFQDNSQKYRNAVQAEINARQKLHNAKTNFELASRQRVAVEAELQKLRAENAYKRNYNNASGAPFQTANARINDFIAADISGRIIGNIPQKGEVLAKDSTLFHILPQDGAKFKIITQINSDDMGKIEDLRNKSTIYLILDDAIIPGNIEAIHSEDNVNFTLEISNDDDNITKLLQAYTAKIQSDEQTNAALYSGHSVPVRAIFWPKNLLTEYLTPLDFLMQPLLRTWDTIFG